MAKPDQIEIRIPTEVELQDVRSLRYEMLDKPLGLPRNNMPSVHDSAPNVIHLAAFDDGKAIGCVRLDDLGDARYLVRRMAIDNKYQMMGMGKRLLSEAENMAQKQGALGFLLNSRKDAVGFYEKQGYYFTGNVKIFHGDKHFEMMKDL